MKIAVILVLCVVSGCQGAGSIVAPHTEPVVISPAAASAIAGDITSRFAEQVPPASATVQIKPGHSNFFIALEAALKGWGYTVSPSNLSASGGAMKLDYELDSFDGELFAALSTPAISVSRAYDSSAAGTVPASPVSVMRKN